MTKRWANALGLVLMAEAEDRLPFQSKARVYDELLEAGMVEPYERVFGRGPFAVTCKGVALTHRGRIAYCETCKDVELP